MRKVRNPDGSIEPGLLIPSEDEYKNYVQRVIGGKKDLDILKKAFDNGYPVLLEGHAGMGKSAMVRAFCAKYRIPYFRVNLNGGTTVDDLVGQWIPYNGGFVWSDGVLVRMMRNGGVLVVDEINAASPDVLFVLNSVLDDERSLVLVQKDGEVVRAHENFLLIATCNPSDYEGVKELNEALRDRFLLQLTISFDKRVESVLIDEKLQTLAKYIRRTYKKGDIECLLSTRQLLALQNNIKVFGYEIAIQSFVNRFHIEGQLLKLVCEAIGLFKTKDTTEIEKKLKELVDDMGTK